MTYLARVRDFFERLTRPVLELRRQKPHLVIIDFHKARTINDPLPIKIEGFIAETTVRNVIHFGKSLALTQPAGWLNTVAKGDGISGKPKVSCKLIVSGEKRYILICEPDKIPVDQVIEEIEETEEIG